MIQIIINDIANKVRAALLTGLSTATNATIAATDSVIVAFGKLQAQITGLGETKQDKRIVVSSNTTAVIDGAYTLVASATFTDPTPQEGKGFSVLLRNGTATIGGTNYSTAGTTVWRVFHSGAWANYVNQLSLGFTPENVANKATNFTTINNTLYPTTQAVSDLIGNPITHLNIFTHLTEFTAGTTTGNFLIAGSTVQSLSGWVIRKDGTNASAAVLAAEVGRSGILRLGTGTTSTGIFRLTAQNISIDGQSFVYEKAIRVQALSTSAQDYYISIGFTVGSVLTPTDALRVFYNHATNSGNFVCERTAGGITSTINTTVALVVDTWFTIRIVKYSNGTVEFFINGVSMGAASSVNAPTGASLTLGFFLSKTAGTTERTCDLDYAYYRET
jgi:hypothetical protein